MGIPHNTLNLQLLLCMWKLKQKGHEFCHSCGIKLSPDDEEKIANEKKI